jgi:tetratricopeptide (TPR) repeat protein
MTATDSGHPPAELLGAFIEGRLDRAASREIATHLEACTECLLVTGETLQLERETDEAEQDAEAAESEDPVHRRWWPMALAAALAGITVLGVVGVWQHRMDPVQRMARASLKLEIRPTEGRLDQFPYAPLDPHRGETSESDPGAMALHRTAEEIARRQPASGNAAQQHSAGVAALLLGRYDDAVDHLGRAASAEPAQAAYWNDLAVARHELARRRFAPKWDESALQDIDRAVALLPNDPGILFNRAVILQALHRHPEASAAFVRYVATDGNSPWADEARERGEGVRPGTP